MVLNTEVKRRINNCRDILVGKVPDPKAQIEQITIALIYKFLDDMDKSYGGNFYFKNELSEYTWEKITDVKLTGEELFKKYTDAIEMFQTAEHFPDFFQSIFKNTYVPYKDARTLSLFLKEIGYFSYENSEQLGDAFEYLLSIMGSQGDAGQFRTPRHIIDFMVEVMEPKVGEKIIDPACGTAGFLISAYNFMRNQKNNKKLSSIEMKNVRDNLFGFDISPDMVRMAKVNMFLHGFENPEIVEFDTLSNDKDVKKWEARYDLILANPPFMTPRGGITPHDLFSVTSNRAEVLFVDYISEHLKKSSGRAGIIVPEGIIFQNGNTYKDLRKKLLERGLYSVVSLPAGVFNPYSGVKTSVLLLDKTISKKTSDILFIKIDEDGLDLGAQRREIKDNDLPLALEILNEYKDKVLNDSNLELEKYEKTIAYIVPKDKIKEKDYNLSGERYKENVVYNGNWDLVELGEIAEFTRGPFGSSIKKSECVGKEEGDYKVYEQGNVINNDFMRGEYYLTKNKFDKLKRFEINSGDLLLTCAGTLGRIAIVPKTFEKGIINSVLMRIRINEKRISHKYLIYLLQSDKIQNNISERSTGVALNNLFSTKELKALKIPLPPLEVQEKIVEEVESYQNILEGSRKVVKSYKPSFKIDPIWEIVELGDVCGKLFAGGDAPKNKSKEKTDQFNIPIYSNGLGEKSIYGYTDVSKVDEDAVTISARGTIGYPQVRRAPFMPIVRLIVAIPNKEKINLHFLKYILGTFEIYRNGNSIPQLTIPMIKHEKIPLPSIEIQKEIVSKIEEEQKLVDSNKELIEIFEKKIKDKISEVWGDKQK
jgi:type I restriction enzyme M protein